VIEGLCGTSGDAASEPPPDCQSALFLRKMGPIISNAMNKASPEIRARAVRTELDQKRDYDPAYPAQLSEGAIVA
jgi:hypothetical protein